MLISAGVQQIIQQMFGCLTHFPAFRTDLCLMDILFMLNQLLDVYV